MPELLETREEERHARRQALRPALRVGHRGPGRQHQAHEDHRLHGSVQAGLKGKTARAPAAPDADGLRVRLGQGSVRALRRHQGLHRADGAGRQARSPPARRTCASSSTTRTSCSTACAPARSGRRHDVGHGRLDPQPRESRHPVHQPEVRRDRLARHLRAAGPRPQRRRRLRLDQFHDAPGDRRARSPSRSATSPPSQGRRRSSWIRACARSSPRASRTASRTSSGIRRSRPASRRSRAGCSTGSRRPIERGANAARRGTAPDLGGARASIKRFADASCGRRAVVQRARAAASSRSSGPSGCGKTTLLRMIAGFIAARQRRHRASAGAAWRGVAPNRRPVNMVFQQLALFPMMSVGENVAFGLARRGVGRAERSSRAEAMLERVGLAGAGAQARRRALGRPAPARRHRAQPGARADAAAAR